MVASDPGRFVLLQQFKNPANPASMWRLAVRNLERYRGAIDVLVSGIGPRHHHRGVSRYINSTLGKKILSVGVEPNTSPVITQTLNTAAPATRPPQDSRARRPGFIPDTLDLSMVDRVELVSNEESIEVAPPPVERRRHPVRYLLCAAVAVALRLARLQEQFKNQTMVVILPDSGERYLSSVLLTGCSKNKRKSGRGLGDKEGVRAALSVTGHMQSKDDCPRLDVTRAVLPLRNIFH